MTRVALYARASTGKQEHSVPGQLDDLRADATGNGRHVVEEITDVGEKRHDADRPGLERLRELAEAGAIDEVWAWSWDRYGSFPVPEVLAVEMRDFGVELRSMDDNGGGEDGEDMQVIRSLFSRREQRDRVRKANRGRRKKSKRGQLHGGFRARYGFRFVKGTNGAGREVNVGYEPNPDTMPNVVRVFEMVAGGAGLKTVRAAFERERIPNPSGGPRWSTTTIRNMVNEDVYRPHTVEELRELGLAADVLDGLDPNGLYGVHWAGRKRSRFKGRSKKREVYEAPREEWIGVPVPLDGSGLDRATVDRARDAIRDNKSPSKVGDRVWELDGGVLKCGCCGLNMSPYRRAKRGGGHNLYYRCRPSSTVDACENRKSHPAERVEGEVFAAVRGMADDVEMLTEKIKERFAAKRRELSRAASDTAPLIEKLADLDLERKGYLRQNARGLLDNRELDDFLSDVDEQRGALQTALDHARHRDERLEELDRQEQSLLSALTADVEGLPHDRVWRYEGADGTVHTMTSIRHALTNTLYAPEGRRRIYKGLGLRVEIDADGTITIDGTLLPPPGAPTTPGTGPERVASRTPSNTLCPPAAATSNARFA